MAKQKAAPAAKSSQLLQFRATMDLEQLVRPFAQRTGLTLSTAFKDLAGLAIIGLDHRHYSLVNQLATTMGGECAFAKACVYLHAALAGATLARGETVLYEEPARTQLVVDVVRGYLSDRGGEMKPERLWFTPITVTLPLEPSSEPHRRMGSELPAEIEPTPIDDEPRSDFGRRVKRRVFSKHHLETEVGRDAEVKRAGEAVD